jgi:hypothetical protein
MSVDDLLKSVLINASVLLYGTHLTDFDRLLHAFHEKGFHFA